MKLIKSLFISVIFGVVLTLAACNSTKTPAEGMSQEAEITENVVQETSGAENAETIIEQIQTVSETQAIPADEGTGKKKNYIGWVDSSGRDIDFKDGIIRLRGKPRLGTYNISVLRENSKYTPVLSTRDEYTGSHYCLKIDKKIYQLNSDANIHTMAKLIDDGIKMLYRIDNVADVEISFETMKSAEEGDRNLVKVTAVVTNLGPKRAQFALKTILDTILGESTQYHFYENGVTPVKSEVMYRDFENVKYIVSKNNNASLYVFVDGADITKPEILALGNYSTLDIKNWEPEMLSYRAFDTVLSYNNSALGISWPAVNLKVEESVNFVFYMGLASEHENPDFTDFFWPPVVEEEPSAEEPEEVTEEISEPKQAPQPKVEKIAPKTATVVSATPAEKPVPNVKFDVSKLTKEQLSPEYIQNLLDRISALEEDDTTINRNELLKLNAELDAILEVLRQ